MKAAKSVRKKREMCPLCGSHEWIGEVRDCVLRCVCKRCGFESKEMVSD